ncbi:hypothetical protein SLS64_005865 [Diaporthe eres]
MAPSPGSSRQQQQHQFGPNPHAMGRYPGQDFSGNPYMAHPQGTINSKFLPLYQRDLQGSDKSTATHQRTTTGHHQQHGSGMPMGFQAPDWLMCPAGHGQGVVCPHCPSLQGPQTQPTSSQAAFSLLANPQTVIPQQITQQSAIPQGTFLLPADPQAAIPQQITQQSAIPQAATAQAFFPQAYFPPVDFPQAANPQGSQVVLPRTAYPEATVPQAATAPEAIPQQTTQQPHYQAQAQQPLAQQPLAQHQPEAPPLTFEQKIAAFSPVPAPHPEPTPRPGRGRKKKNQRFWAPQDANEDLRHRYEMLQTVDDRVDTAEKKLAKNNKPSRTVHLQNILLRNMQEREDLWTQCQRLELGVVAVELPIPEAEAKTKRLHQSWVDGSARLQARQASLRTEHPHAVGNDGEIDLKRLGVKDRQGLQTMINWLQHKWLALCDSFWTMRDAHHRAYGTLREAAVLYASRIHALGCYEGWSLWRFPGDSPQNIGFRKRFSNPDPSTWDLELGPSQVDEILRDFEARGHPKFTEQEIAEYDAIVDSHGEFQLEPPPAQEAATNEQVDLSPPFSFSSSDNNNDYYNNDNQVRTIDPRLLQKNL